MLLRHHPRAARFVPLLIVCCHVCSIGSPAVARDLEQDESARRILADNNVRGGLIVHLGCGDGKMTSSLRINDSYLVHGLDANAGNVAAAREHVRKLGAYGKVSVDRFDAKHLPYTDNLVNLLVADDLGEVSMDEVRRVLAPLGVARIGDNTIVKPWPSEIDEWTHFLHGPDNNAVAHDARVSSPLHVQWVGGPRWARHHNHLSSTSAIVSSAGRLFAIVDEGPAASLVQPPKWRLVARDAFNGLVLWKKPIGPWEGHLRPFRSGPVDLARRLVAVEDRVFVTPGYNKPVVALDAASGDVARAYPETKGACEIVCDRGVLYTVIGTIDPQSYAASRR